MLCDECRSNSCIEHAKGIMEEVKAPENLSKRISNMSLTAADKKVLLRFIYLLFFSEDNHTFYMEDHWEQNCWLIRLTAFLSLSFCQLYLRTVY